MGRSHSHHQTPNLRTTMITSNVPKGQTIMWQDSRNIVVEYHYTHTREYILTFISIHSSSRIHPYPQPNYSSTRVKDIIWVIMCEWINDTRTDPQYIEFGITTRWMNEWLTCTSMMVMMKGDIEAYLCQAFFSSSLMIMVWICWWWRRQGSTMETWTEIGCGG
jgi:hypothetical protein